MLMKISLSLFILLICFVSLQAQGDRAKQTDKRAREMFKAIASDNPETWKKFITENYTQQLIDKPMRSQVATSQNDGSGDKTSTSSSESGKNLEAKVAMFKQLHEDFGNGKITWIKNEVDQLSMAVEADGLQGIFLLKFEKNSPWKIDGLGIDVESTER
jgi:hypothetical protein